jgi:hypothetical protein
MSILHNTTCYLAGPVEHDLMASSWRNELAIKLSAIGIKVYDPLIKPKWFPSSCRINPAVYREVLRDGPAIAKTICGEDNFTTINVRDVFTANAYMRKVCLRIVSAVDWVICYLPIKPTFGTCEEVYDAIYEGKPVLFCCPDGIPSTWILGAASTADDYSNVFFKDWDSLLKHVLKIDKGLIKLDPVKWIFLTWRREDLERMNGGNNV